MAKLLVDGKRHVVAWYGGRFNPISPERSDNRRMPKERVALGTRATPRGET
jgi:hypothetical protein